MRTREYRRKVRKKKIKQRQRLIHNAGIAGKLHCEYPGGKISGALYCEGKSGYLAKHDYGAVSGNHPVKTKTKKIRTHPHRALGGFGPSRNYSRRDRNQLERMRQALVEYRSEC